ncbi:MAG: hypothetical protein IKO55_04710, partial [Kiritimatiellae bacterium]|nr:hypothetical protein [Kiritimatiellia bacterium]
KLQKAFRFETMMVQFKTLIGSMDEARAHMAMLQKMGDTPPFSMEQFAAASRSMMVMSDGALGYRKSLEMVGDAAAATGQPIETLAHEVGRAYAVIRDGQPIARATMSLRNMGVITPEVAAKMDEMQKSGASNVEIWNELQAALGRYSGAMKETEQTGEGLIGAISSQWDNAVRDFGEAFMGVSKGGLSRLLEKMRELREDGSIAVWADKVGRAVGSIAAHIQTAIGWLGKLKKAYDWVRDGAERIGSAVGAYVGTLIGGGTMEDAADAAGIEWNQMKQEQADRKAEAKKMEAQIRAESVAARKKAAEESAKVEANARLKEETRITKQLATAQAKANAEARKKFLEEERKARLEKDKAANTERADDLKNKLKKAQDDVATAFEQFRDPKKLDLKAERRAKRREEIDRVRLANAAIDLQARNPNWRFARNLNRRDEAARRWLLAKENEQKVKNEQKQVVDKLSKIEKLLEAATTL